MMTLDAVIWLGGVIVPIVSPLHRYHGMITVDHYGLENHCENLIWAGVDWLFANGATGELPYTSPLQKAGIAKVVARSVRDSNTRACIGITGRTTQETHDILDNINKLTAPYYDIDAIVLAPLVNCDDNEIQGYVLEILEKSNYPLILYSQHGYNLDIGAVRELAQHPQVIGLKESSGDLEYTKECINAVDGNCVVLQGDQTKYPQAFKLGVTGVVPSLGNPFPELPIGLDRALREGRLEDVELYNTWVLDVGSAISSNYSKVNRSSKYILKTRRTIEDDMLHPKNQDEEPLTDTEKQTIHEQSQEVSGFLQSTQETQTQQ